MARYIFELNYLVKQDINTKKTLIAQQIEIYK
ncbi:Uncharacterised protein [Legionella bozemanae]|nr:Uncharacterised protein [Legionella bozemanae]